MWDRELKDARDYIARARELFIEAARASDHETACILFALGRTFLQTAAELERRIEAQLRRSGAAGLLHDLGRA